MDFTLTEEHLPAQKMVRDFCPFQVDGVLVHFSVSA